MNYDIATPIFSSFITTFMLNEQYLKWLVYYVPNTGFAMKRLQFRKENKADL